MYRIVPVDIYVPMSTKAEALLYGILQLQKKSEEKVLYKDNEKELNNLIQLLRTDKILKFDQCVRKMI